MTPTAACPGRLLLLATALLLTLAARAQPALVLRGQVVDAETRQPVPNAQVGVADNRYGTSTNAEGRFALPIPAAVGTATLEVAVLGYRRYVRPLPPLPGPPLRVELRPSPAALGGVTVSGSVLGIVREAVARIPQNYPVRPTRLTGFYRESDNSLTAGGQYHYLVEGLLLLVKPSYRRPRDEGQVKILEARRATLDKSALNGSNWLAGPFIPHRFDFVHRRPEFISERRFRDYTYTLSRQSSYHDRPVFVIEFGPRPGNIGANYAGRLFIAEDTYAFLGAEWRQTANGIRHEAPQMHGFRVRHRSYRVEYQPYAGRWHLKSVAYLTQGLPTSGDSVRHLSEYLTTAIDTAQGPDLPYLERAQYDDVFLRNAVHYDSTFWQQHTTRLPDADLRQAFDTLRQQQAAKVFGAAVKDAPESWPLRLLRRLRYGGTVGPLPLMVPTAALAVDFTPGGAAFSAQSAPGLRAQRLTYLRRSQYQFDLTPRWQLHYATYNVYRQLRGQGWEAGLTYAHNLNPRHRPIFLRTGLSYATLRAGREIGTFDNPARLAVGGKRLGADRLSVQLEAQTRGLLPRVGVGVEATHKVEILADVGYLLPTTATRTQLRVAEESGFFPARQRAVLPLPAPDVSVLVNGQPATALPWVFTRYLFSLGLLYRLL